MNALQKAKAFLSRREGERGQSLVFFALAIVGLLALASLAVDGGRLWVSRRDRQNFSDQACLDGAIAAMHGNSANVAILNSLAANAVDPVLYSPNEGTGTSLGKGIELGSSIRVAIWGESESWLVTFAGLDFLEMGARARCERGTGGVLPLTFKEWEDGSKILETSDPNDTWTGACPDQSIDPDSDPSTRTPANCWVWGDWQVLAGDGHVPNEGGVSMNGLIAPDVRCNGAPGDTNKCTDKTFVPPVDPAALNTLKDITMEYICGGYTSIWPVPGNYDGVTSANLGQMEGVTNHMLVQEVDKCYDVGDLAVVMVYAAGRVWDGNKNYDYVEIIGFAVVRIVFMDANTVAIVPVYPEHNLGDPTTMRDDLPRTLDEIEDAGFDTKAHLIRWED